MKKEKTLARNRRASVRSDSGPRGNRVKATPARVDLAAINDELNALEWDPPLRSIPIRWRVRGARR